MSEWVALSPLERRLSVACRTRRTDCRVPDDDVPIWSTARAVQRDVEYAALGDRLELEERLGHEAAEDR